MSTDKKKALVIDGVEYEIPRIKKEHLDELKREIRRRRPAALQLLKQDEFKSLPPDAQTIAARSVIGLASRHEITQDDLNEFLLSIEGSAFVMWLLLKDVVPGLTKEKVAGLLDAEMEAAAKKAEGGDGGGDGEAASSSE